MRILFTTKDYDRQPGGIQRSVHELVLPLLDRGHRAAVLGFLHEDRTPAARLARARRKLTRRPTVVEERHLGYPVFRPVVPSEAMPAARRGFRPDVVVVNVGGATTLGWCREMLDGSCGLPTLLYMRDVEGMGLLDEQHGVPVLTNARRLSELAAERGVAAPVIPSVIDVQRYRVTTTREVVLYVNPVPRKGVDLAWTLAEARPDIPFVFLEGWVLDQGYREEMVSRARRLGNVEVRRAVEDPRLVYRDSRVLLAPYGEERPRVVVEAQASGIPVLGTQVSGLEDTTGPGGILVPPDAPVSDWVAALSRLWDDPVSYRRYAEAALRHSRRPDLNPEALVDRFEEELLRVVEATVIR